MNFLIKIEDFINMLIIRFGELMMRIFKRLTPVKVVVFYERVKVWISYLKNNFKTLPATIQVLLMVFFGKAKVTLKSYDYRARAHELSQKAQDEYKKKKTEGVSKSKVPFLIIAEWMEGLSISQSIILTTFTCASILAGYNIFASGNKLVDLIKNPSRAPASIEEEIKYDRPLYYKKDDRHLLVSNIRLPVYVGGVNDLRAVDIDFNATMSNRQSKRFLERFEFQLRDYLILHVEPLVASFPLEDEGREILKQKIKLEINNFLIERNVEGHVTEMKVTYILAN